MKYNSIEDMVINLLEDGWTMEPNAFVKNGYEISFFDEFGDKPDGGEEIILRRYDREIRIPLSDFEYHPCTGLISISVE